MTVVTLIAAPRVREPFTCESDLDFKINLLMNVQSIFNVYNYRKITRSWYYQPASICQRLAKLDMFNFWSQVATTNRSRDSFAQARASLQRNLTTPVACQRRDYINRNVKETAYNKLLENVINTGMPATVELLKKKIKSLRDTYRKELSKIKKSIKSGAGANEVYKPKLVWFPTAEVFQQRCSSSV
ncbi:hypothetical protein J6590_090516 [Homalodisca vitripennis]|nr:hypothetical protein J6590_090516 [Homalodisca vitripennis]